MDIYGDPAKDRDEFEDRLTSMFNNVPDMYTKMEANEAGNTELAIECTQRMTKRRDRKKAYLDKWDAATTYEERQKIVGSVKADYESPI